VDARSSPAVQLAHEDARAVYVRRGAEWVELPAGQNRDQRVRAA